MTTTAPARPAAPPPPARPSGLRRAGALLLRWWRRLTAMRTALVLLFLLALVAIPGSLLPQRSLSQNAVRQYFVDHPQLAPILDRLYLFDVFSSPWFAAVYLLLFISLIGCVLPRAAEHARALRTPPPPAPRHLLRLPDAAELTTTLPPKAALDVVEEELRVRRFRMVRRGTAAGPELSAEKGLLKETGNLVFHLSLVALLLALAAGKLWGYQGSILVTEGQGFCNSFQQYDNYSAGPLVRSGDLAPLCLTLEEFRARYEENLTAASYTARVKSGRPGEPGRPATIGVNSPLRVDGTRVYVTGHGFSPVFDVRLPDGRGFTGLSAPFLPSNTQTMASEGALKLPDLGPGSRSQLALEGFFAPTGVVQGGILTSIDPRPLEPQVAIFVYQGYLGLDSGLPQSVYSLDQQQIQRGVLTKVAAANLKEGQSVTLPDGTAITFSGLKEFASFQVSHDPGQVWVLAAAVTTLAGLLGMLLLRRERFFARAVPARGQQSNPDGAPAGPGGTVLTVASLVKGSAESALRFAAVTSELRAALVAAESARARAPEPEASRSD